MQIETPLAVGLVERAEQQDEAQVEKLVRGVIRAEVHVDRRVEQIVDATVGVDRVRSRRSRDCDIQ